MNDDYDSDYNNWTSTTTSESGSTAKPNSIPTELATLVAKESCIVITLPPGDYSARVFGLGGLTGIGRVGINKVE